MDSADLHSGSDLNEEDFCDSPEGKLLGETELPEPWLLLEAAVALVFLTSIILA